VGATTFQLVFLKCLSLQYYDTMQRFSELTEELSSTVAQGAIITIYMSLATHPKTAFTST